MGRKHIRALQKKVKKMEDNEKFHLLMAAQQNAVDKSMLRLAPEVIKHGAETAYLYLYEEFLKPIVEKQVSDEEATELMNKLVSKINEEYLKAVISREKEKQRVAQAKEKIESEN